MGNYAIKVEGLGKRYRIGERQQYKALRDVLTDAVYAPVRAAGRLLRGGSREAQPDSTIWALKDVSFEVAHGEVLGIIGRNGAGKSTLLKILSRITEPTEGEVRLRGRVGSLLEVGTGFHPELTGRENVYLNGAILGMRRAEMERKFDEIVAFAEVEKFLDTPVKHYSSGMMVRLGFAVAAHLEPEILLVDEVLAVGDAAFQRKCLGKMGHVAEQGRTVLLVSHNMAAVLGMCKRTVVVEAGHASYDGETSQAVERYLALNAVRSRQDGMLARSPDGEVELLSIDVLTRHGQPTETCICGQDLSLRIVVRTHKRVATARFVIGIDSTLGVRIGVLDSALQGSMFSLQQSTTTVICRVPNLPLVPGEYSLWVRVVGGDTPLVHCSNALRLRVESGDFFGSGRMGSDAWIGSVLFPHTWTIETAADLSQGDLPSCAP